VAHQFAPLKIIQVCIDDDAGYAQLAEAEQKLHIAQPGDLTVILSVPAPPSPPAEEEKGRAAEHKQRTEQLVLASTLERRDVEQYLAAVVKRLRNPAEGKGRLEPDVSAFAAEVFGKGARAEAGPDNTAEHNRYYAVFAGTKRVGWIVDAFRHVGCPTCNDMQFLMAVSGAEPKVLLIRPQRDLERLAVRLDDSASKTFLEQFKGRNPETSQIKVDAVSGVTKTCRLYEGAVRDALAEIQKREKQ
ncbi:MAG: hypothetical protein ABSE73_17545, partial [Planctomycetota bacterium]